MATRALVVLSLLGAIAGCRETHHCDQGNSYQNGECLPIDDAGHAAVDTGSDDASIDDAGHDAPSPCDLCAPGQVCSNSGDAGVDGGAPSCVECVNDGDCAGAVLHVPDGGGTDAGTSSLGTAICENFLCVRGCRRDSDCSTGICRVDSRCSAYSSYTLSAMPCLPCDTDANCDPSMGFLCLPFHYQNGAFGHDGHYCLRHAAACGAATAPLANASTASPMPSIDGVAVTDMTCVPATSCEGLVDAANARPCTSLGDQCGLPMVDDGLCSLTSHCTIRCSSANVCPDIAPNCTGAPAACAP